MSTISTIKRLAASTVIAGSLSLALGGAAVAVASSANAAPSSATDTTSSQEKAPTRDDPGHLWEQHAEGSSEAIREGDAGRASELRPHWEEHRGK
ncbi:hypothetical protein FHT44_000640 [Mycolicibacterium sp. BK634]|uniref:hypothetical protein n=1 Tax=Mycolicibacterium sp. BK634 TaxID=2587099 RepID=UPI0016212217|nr:hypothetical protein [Mycolicibacterium sp. BK634]MBB3748179.1 hypothetical protein [Mycolicibacterium sp. BK634]